MQTANPPKILIVDDEPQVVEHVITLLQNFGYSSQFITRPSFLFQILERGEIQLILMDVNMPEIDGLTLLSELRQHPKYFNIPVIMLTGDDRETLIAECFDKGASDFITKPITAMALKARIQASLTAKAYEEELNQKVEELSQERQILSSIINNVPELIYVKNHQHQFVVVNESLVEAVGAGSGDNLVGKSDDDYHTQEDAAKFRADEQQVMESGIPMVGKEETAVLHGENRWLSTTKVAWKNSKGEIIGVIGLGRDITEITRDRMQVLKLNKELTHINEVIRMVNSSLDVEDVVAAAMEALHEVFWFDQIGIQMLDEKKQNLVFKEIYGRGITSEQIRQIKELRFSIAEEESIFVETLLGKKRTFVPMITDEMMDGLSPSDRSALKISTAKSYLCYPLTIRSQAIGTVSFANLVENFELTEEQMDTIERYVFQIGTAINNAELYETIQKQQRQLQSAMESLQKQDEIIQEELDMASEIQTGTLPDTPMTLPHLHLVSHYQAMGKVGGDLFNVIPMKSGEIAILMADAIGHGIPAAFITMMAQIIFNEMLQRDTSPQAILRQANQLMGEILKNDEYMTAFLMIILTGDSANSLSPIPEKRQTIPVIYGNANHPAAIVIRKNKEELDHFETKGMFLGFFEDDEVGETYEEKMDQFYPGDRVFLYTDGITEARSTEKEQFQEARLEKLLQQTKDLPLEEVKSEILHALQNFTRGVPARDDVTFILLEILE
ncbi:MAG: SpoIIE family protein phosphatase [SAR324 cluster bacterium]|nr:SpoIIE family protein phosphatase [SAR324 cluster bacterium]